MNTALDLHIDPETDAALWAEITAAFACAEAERKAKRRSLQSQIDVMTFELEQQKDSARPDLRVTQMLKNHIKNKTARLRKL